VFEVRAQQPQAKKGPHGCAKRRTLVNCRLVDALDIAARGWDTTGSSLPAVALATAS
jgi:hypothetical protein